MAKTTRTGRNKNPRGMDTKEELIAPCGMNCSLCSAYLAYKHDLKSRSIKMPYCKGCRIRDKQCAFLKKRCGSLLNKKVKYCSECNNFPCKNLLGIDARYKKNFRMSLIENLRSIETKGIDEFLKEQDRVWNCGKCGGMVCCHNGLCFNCELDELKNKKKLYRWNDD